MMPRKRQRSPPRRLPSGQQFEIAGAGLSEDEEGADFGDLPANLSDEDFHRFFSLALFEIGVSVASPAKIFQEMLLAKQFPQLKSEQMKSHLQRFRKNEEANKTKFLEDYDGFLQTLQLVEQQKRMHGESSVIDLAKVLGGKAAALISYKIMNTNGSKVISSAPAVNPYKSNAIGNIEPPAASRSSDDQLTKIIGVRLTDAEKTSPVGLSLLHAMRMMKYLEMQLLQQRNFQQLQRKPTVPAVSIDTTREQAKHERKQEKAVPNRKSVRKKRSTSLEKLCRLVSEISERELKRRSRTRRKKNTRSRDADIDGDSSSSDESEPNPKYLRYKDRRRTGSLGASTVSTRSFSPRLTSANCSSPVPSSEDQNEWIFEGIPKPDDLRAGGTLLDMSSSSSSLSSSESGKDNHAPPKYRQQLSESVRQRRQATQRLRSSSDVSLIGHDDGIDLYVDADGSIRSSRASSNDAMALDTIHEERPISPQACAEAAAAINNDPPSPSATAVMDFMEQSILQDSGFSTLVLESNWEESDYLARSSRPASPSQHPQGLQRRLQPRRQNTNSQCNGETNSYQSYEMLPTDFSLQPAPISQPLAKPPTLASPRQETAQPRLSEDYNASTYQLSNPPTESQEDPTSPQRRASLGLFHPVDAFPEAEQPNDPN